jgi:hypothetical protein
LDTLQVACVISLLYKSVFSGWFWGKLDNDQLLSDLDLVRALQRVRILVLRFTAH